MLLFIFNIAYKNKLNTQRFLISNRVSLFLRDILSKAINL